MANFPQNNKTTARRNERGFPFVIQIAVPDGGFGCTLDAIDAWHCYNRNGQPPGRRQYRGEQEFCSWCFEGLESAKAFRQRFGGEIMPVTIRRRVQRRRDFPPPVSAVGKSVCAAPERATDRHP